MLGTNNGAPVGYDIVSRYVGGVAQYGGGGVAEYGGGGVDNNGGDASEVECVARYCGGDAGYDTRICAF